MKIGILGGGQLGRMFIQKTLDFGIEINVLDPDDKCPCRYICNSFTLGDFNDYETVYNFGKKADVITIEIEHVNVDALEKLEQEGKKVYPQPGVLRSIQDKGLQKEFYKKHSIPSPDFVLVNSKDEISKHTGLFPVMQKLRKGGYDGKGVTPIKSEGDLATAFDAPSVLEKFTEIKKEISVIAARNKAGDVSVFPLTELVFNNEANLVDYLFSPADVENKIEKRATEIARQIANELKIVGILAVEMFVTKNDEVLVNEIAPRPHNSGHQTIEANITSQYEQHLRAIMNWPLGSTDIIQPAVMVNLLGEKGYSGPVKLSGLEEILNIPGVKLHMYGKETTKPFRKMGHVTITGETIREALDKAESVKKTLRVIA